MQVQIKGIENCSGKLLVTFESNIGAGTGVWIGERPSIGKLTDIEFDIVDDFKWGGNIDLTNSDKFKVIAQKNGFRFIAKIISYDTDGSLTVQLGETFLFLNIEAAPKDIDGWVEGEAKSVRLHPVNL